MCLSNHINFESINAAGAIEAPKCLDTGGYESLSKLVSKYKGTDQKQTMDQTGTNQHIYLNHPD